MPLAQCRKVKALVLPRDLGTRLELWPGHERQRNVLLEAEPEGEGREGVLVVGWWGREAVR